MDDRTREAIAELNELGFITKEYQREGPKKRERAYMRGFVPNKILRDFLLRVNDSNGIIAWGSPPVQYKNEDVFTASIPVSSEACMPITRTFFFAGKEDIECYKSIYHLKQFDEITMVTCVDTVWGRKFFSRKGLHRTVKEAIKSCIPLDKPVKVSLNLFHPLFK